eukprot:scaffold4884_cov50-Attheya_sp.AAC.2
MNRRESCREAKRRVRRLHPNTFYDSAWREKKWSAKGSLKVVSARPPHPKDRYCEIGGKIMVRAPIVNKLRHIIRTSLFEGEDGQRKTHGSSRVFITAPHFTIHMFASLCH